MINNEESRDLRNRALPVVTTVVTRRRNVRCAHPSVCQFPQFFPGVDSACDFRCSDIFPYLPSTESFITVDRHAPPYGGEHSAAVYVVLATSRRDFFAISSLSYRRMFLFHVFSPSPRRRNAEVKASLYPRYLQLYKYRSRSVT